MQEFKPITKTTISSRIVEQVLSMIRSEGFKPGDKLPTERELSEAFQVGRSSVREAMKILEATGLVVTTNRGKYVSLPIEQPINTLDATRTTIHEVFEARKLMEIELTALAAHRATQDDIKNIGKTSKLLAESDELHEAYAADLSFHKAVVDSAHNSVFSQIYSMVSGLLYQQYKVYLHIAYRQGTSSYAKQIAPDHERIFEAIKTRDSSAAKRAVRRHLNHAETQLLSALEQEQKAPGRVQSKLMT